MGEYVPVRTVVDGVRVIVGWAEVDKDEATITVNSEELQRSLDLFSVRGISIERK